MDIIRASTIGVKNTVATMGTALTKEHIKDIRRLSNNIILCFDGDAPGIKATLSAGEAFKEEGIETKVIELSGDDDPDTYILKNGGAAFKTLINNAIYFSDFKIKNISSNYNFTSSEDKANYIHEVMKEIIDIDDPVRIEIVLKDLAKKFEIGYNTLEKSFQEQKAKNSKENIKKDIIIPVKQPQQEKKDKYQKATLAIIYYMLNKQEIIDLVESKHLVFPTGSLRALESEIVYFYHKYGFINEADFYTYLAPKQELISILSEVMSLDLNSNITKEDIMDYINVIKEYNLKNEIKRLEQKINETTDQTLQIKYAEEIRKLRIGES